MFSCADTINATFSLKNTSAKELGSQIDQGKVIPDSVSPIEDSLSPSTEHHKSKRIPVMLCQQPEDILLGQQS
jgi:hypothetical protein